jgi:hypothetical protein
MRVAIREPGAFTLHLRAYCLAFGFEGAGLSWPPVRENGRGGVEVSPSLEKTGGAGLKSVAAIALSAAPLVDQDRQSAKRVGLALVVIGRPKGRRFSIWRGPGCPARGGRRGSAVTHWGVGDGMGQIYPNNTTFGAHHFRGTPGRAPMGWPRSCLLAHRAFWRAGLGGAGAGSWFFCRAGRGLGGVRVNKISLVVLRLKAGFGLAVLPAQRVHGGR